MTAWWRQWPQSPCGDFGFVCLSRFWMSQFVCTISPEGVVVQILVPLDNGRFVVTPLFEFRRLSANWQHHKMPKSIKWLQINENSPPNYPFLVSVFAVGINSKSFPWPIDSAPQTSTLTDSNEWRHLTTCYCWCITNSDSGRGLMMSLGEGTDMHSLTIDHICYICSTGDAI